MSKCYYLVTMEPNPCIVQQAIDSLNLLIEEFYTREKDHIASRELEIGFAKSLASEAEVLRNQLLCNPLVMDWIMLDLRCVTPCDTNTAEIRLVDRNTMEISYNEEEGQLNIAKYHTSVPKTSLLKLAALIPVPNTRSERMMPMMIIGKCYQRFNLCQFPLMLWYLHQWFKQRTMKKEITTATDMKIGSLLNKILSPTPAWYWRFNHVGDGA